MTRKIATLVCTQPLKVEPSKIEITFVLSHLLGNTIVGTWIFLSVLTFLYMTTTDNNNLDVYGQEKLDLQAPLVLSRDQGSEVSSYTVLESGRSTTVFYQITQELTMQQKQLSKQHHSKQSTLRNYPMVGD